jgi:polyhydroxyalkanoate depolymerase
MTTQTMLYPAYELRRALSAPLYELAGLHATTLRHLPEPIQRNPSVRALRAVSETVEALRLTHARPRFGIETVRVNGKDFAVREQAVASTAFGTLVRFAKEIEIDQPKVLLVPGLAGHFATLIRATVQAFLPDHDVFVADWHNARDVPVRAGRFGLDEYIAQLIDFLAKIGAGAHLVAVCQPCAPALAAAAIIAEDGHEAQPRSLVLMAGPVDARVNPGPVNRFAAGRSLGLLERTVITTVPWPYEGTGRRVYPGFLQAAGFMGMAPRRHISAFLGLMRDTAAGAEDAAARTREFYEEYFAVLDVTAEFYLDTARAIFQDHDLARGRLRWRGRLVDPAAITSALLTISARESRPLAGVTTSSPGSATTASSAAGASSTRSTRRSAASSPARRFPDGSPDACRPVD